MWSLYITLAQVKNTTNRTLIVIFYMCIYSLDWVVSNNYGHTHSVWVVVNVGSENKDVNNVYGLDCCSVSKNDIFEILCNERRRHALDFLNTGGDASVRDISEYIAGMENDGDFENKARKSIHISLLQNHIPKLESLGIVEYNRKMDVIALLPAAKKVCVYMEVVEKGNIPWSEYYLVVSGSSLVGVAVLYYFTVDFISTPQWTFVMLMLLFASSVIHFLALS